jgi:siroheme synthase
MASGYDRRTPVAVVENGTTDRQRVVRTVLGSLGRAQAALSIEPPALLIVGDTASFAERYSWFAPSHVETFETEQTQDRARVSY